MPLDYVQMWLMPGLGVLADIGSRGRVDSCFRNIPLDCVRMWLTLGLGVVTGISFHKRLGCMGLPMFGLFVLGADPRLDWSRWLVGFWLEKLGWWDGPIRHLLWRPEWTFVSVVLFALLAWWLIRESRKVKVSQGHRGAQQGEFG